MTAAKLLNPAMPTDTERMEWQPIASAPEGVEVETRIFDANGERNVQSLTRRGTLWFFPDLSMYVYYRPTHWKPLRAAIDAAMGEERKE